jgi:hypothetical protein
MTQPDIDPIRELLHRALVRYLTVRPRGFELDPGAPLRQSLEVRILGHGGARTLYEDRKPACRSLDGVRPVTGDVTRICANCLQRPRCTPQIRVDLIAERRHFRLLLAYTAAKALLLYEASLRQRGLVIEDVVTVIGVVDRGWWGELRFRKRD